VEADIDTVRELPVLHLPDHDIPGRLVEPDHIVAAVMIDVAGGCDRKADPVPDPGLRSLEGWWAPLESNNPTKNQAERCSRAQRCWSTSVELMNGTYVAAVSLDSFD